MANQRVVSQRWYDRTVGALWAVAFVVALGIVGGMDRDDAELLDAQVSHTPDAAHDDEGVGEFLAYRDGFRDGELACQRAALADGGPQ